MPKDVEEFRVDLSDEYLDYYKVIKKTNKIRKKVDVFRYALKVTYEVERDEATPYTLIDPSLKKRIQRMTRREDVRAKFNIFRYEGFLKKGIELLLEQIEEYAFSRSILHWDVLNSLDGDQKVVALTLKELLLTDPFKEVRFSTLLEELGWRDDQRLRKILDDFVFQNLLKAEILNDEPVYHAIVPE